jgi:nitrogen fixation/metabolism regulation signal transduction histidine kinase
MTDQEKQSLIDEEHLRLLRIGYLVAGGADLFFAFIPIIYIVIGIGISAVGISVPTRPNEPNPAVIGLFLIVFGIVFSLFFVAQSVLQLLAARALGQRRSRLLCQIAAGASCLQMPWGVLLAVFTFIVLGKASVKQLFDPKPVELMPAPARAVSSLFDSDEVDTREKAERLRQE